jgi:hypothetical protein
VPLFRRTNKYLGATLLFMDNLGVYILFAEVMST